MPETVVAQRQLSQEQIDNFHVERFVHKQITHFTDFMRDRPLDGSRKVVDMGGGIGQFAAALHLATGLSTRVVDLDQKSLDVCRSTHGRYVETVHGDAVSPVIQGDEGVVCFNLILHHLVGDTEKETLELQRRALAAWKGKADYLFVNEYAYDSIVGDLGGRLIYAITKSKILSSLVRFIGRFVPSLRANTLGVGVRFRSHDEWLRLFERWGFVVVDKVYGWPEEVSLPRRLLLLKRTEKDSFLLKAM